MKPLWIGNENLMLLMVGLALCAYWWKYTTVVKIIYFGLEYQMVFVTWRTDVFYMYKISD